MEKQTKHREKRNHSDAEPQQENVSETAREVESGEEGLLKVGPHHHHHNNNNQSCQLVIMAPRTVAVQMHLSFSGASEEAARRTAAVTARTGWESQCTARKRATTWVNL